MLIWLVGDVQCIVQSIISYHNEKAWPYDQITRGSLVDEDMTMGLQVNLPYFDFCQLCNTIMNNYSKPSSFISYLQMWTRTSLLARRHCVVFQVSQRLYNGVRLDLMLSGGWSGIDAIAMVRTIPVTSTHSMCKSYRLTSRWHQLCCWWTAIITASSAQLWIMITILMGIGGVSGRRWAGGGGGGCRGGCRGEGGVPRGDHEKLHVCVILHV